jgi:raffinose/stachyose/melibiose transport system permease protein
MTSATNIPVHVKKNRTAGDWAILILLIVGGLVMLFPFIVLLLNAFKTTADYNSSGPLSWPKEFSTVGLMKFWNRVNYPEKLWNSIWTSGLVAILAVVLSMFNAFALGIGRVKGRRWIVLLIMLANMLPQEAMLYPLYIMFNKLGILNTKLPVLLACVLINVPLIIWFLISFFQDLPEEVEESAKVDGATEWQLFCRIVLPLVAPGIAAVAMLSFMYAWNEYTYTVIFTRTAANNTVPLALALLNTEDNLTNFGLVAAGGVVSVIPITLFVIFAQNYLISGLSSGAVKE